jgi:hypothetical protein
VRAPIPQQSYYRRFWSEEATERMSADAQLRRGSAGSAVERFEASLGRRPLLSRLWYLWKALRSRIVRRLPARLPPPDLRF